MDPGTTVLRNGILGLSGPGRITFSYLGTSAAFTNQFLAGGTPIFDNTLGTQPPVAAVFGAGPLVSPSAP